MDIHYTRKMSERNKDPIKIFSRPFACSTSPFLSSQTRKPIAISPTFPLLCVGILERGNGVPFQISGCVPESMVRNSSF
jgi:hypothetical protein